jgi:two-component system, sporulation sensor kinase E
MDRSNPSEASSCLAQLAHELVGERDPVRVVRRTWELLRRELTPSWSCAIGDGESALGGLRLAQACADPEAACARLQLPETAPEASYELCERDTAAAITVWLPQHTRVVLAFGVGPGKRALLADVACYLLARLRDTLELERARLATKALERRYSDLSLLFKGIDVTLSSVELTKVLRAFMTCVTAGEAIGFNRAFLLLLDEEQRELRGTVAVGPSSGEEAGHIWTSLAAERPSLEEILRRSIQDPEVEPDPGSLADRFRRFVLPLDPNGSILARAVLSSAPYNISVHRGDQTEPFAAAFGAGEFVVIPIQGRERTLGVIVADNLYSGEPIETERVHLLSGLANHVGVVIENALMFEDVSRRYAELSEVQSINRALLSSVDYVEVLRRIAQISASMLKAQGSLLFIAQGQPAEPRLEMQYHVAGAALPETMIQRCNELARSTLLGKSGTFNLQVDARAGRGLVVADLVSVPMSIDQQVVGVLMVYRAADGAPFDRHSWRFLSIIADQAAIALLSGRRMQTIRYDQQQIEQLNELIYRNEKLAALGQASAKIAHEIRNPLTALGGFARRMLRSSNLEPQDREAAQVIVTETGRLERILNDQLAFVRSARLQRAPASLNDVVIESRTLLRPQLQAGRAELQVELDPRLPLATLDADRMKQVLVNLLMNAIAAVQPQGTIRVVTRGLDGAVELEVSNTGPPIPAEVREMLFVPFVTSRQEGTGLGLAVVHQIVTEHGGTIQVLSDERWGTIFRIRLGTRGAETVDEATRADTAPR